MKFTELKKNLSSGGGCGIYLVEGDDAYFRERSVEMLKTAFVTQPELNFTVFDGDAVTAAPDALVSAATAYPFMSEKRMVLVKEFYPKDDYISKNLSELFDNPPRETVLVFENAKPSEAIKKRQGVEYIDCDKADMDILCRWIMAEAAKNGVKIISMDAEKLAEYCLRDMVRISNETQKLIAYAKPKGVITEEDVNLLVSKDTEYQIYEMTDFIGKHRYDAALTVVKDMLAKGELPQRLVISIYNYYRRMLHVALSGLDNSELSKLLGIKEYAVKKTREQAKAFKKKSLKKAVDYLCECDYASKNGKTTFDEALWSALFEIMV